MFRLRTVAWLTAVLMMPFACNEDAEPEEDKPSGPPCENELKGSCGDECETDEDCPERTHCRVEGTCSAECTVVGQQCQGTCDVRGRCSLLGGTGGGPMGGGGAPNGGLVEINPDEDPPFDECAGWEAQPEIGPAVMMLVVDISGSMGDPDPSQEGSDVPSKWEITQAALATALDDLPATVAVGALYYPNYADIPVSEEPRDPSVCVNIDEIIEIERLGAAGSAHREQLMDSLDKTPAHGTPTHDAYDYGYKALLNANFVGKKNLVLITDGEPTFAKQCIGDGGTPRPAEPIIEAIELAAGQDMTTFVIGSPGSELSREGMVDTRPWLSEAAEAGGSALGDCSHEGEPYCHFDMSVEPDFASGLKDALATISGQVVSCDVELPEPPNDATLDLDKVNVVFRQSNGDAFIVLPDLLGTCTDGWHYNEDQTRIELCEATCKRLTDDPGSTLEMKFGCDTVVDVE